MTRAAIRPRPTSPPRTTPPITAGEGLGALETLKVEVVVLEVGVGVGVGVGGGGRDDSSPFVL